MGSVVKAGARLPGIRTVGYAAILVLAAAIACPAAGNAETHSVTWGAVTTYTDGTAIGSGTSVTYNFYWTSDPGLSSGRSKSIG